MRMEKFTFFWHTASPFSQWHPADFIVNGLQYTSAEQYMMHQKALLFGDLKIAEQIMSTNSASVQKSWADRSKVLTRPYGKPNASALFMKAIRQNLHRTRSCWRLCWLLVVQHLWKQARMTGYGVWDLPKIILVFAIARLGEERTGSERF